MKKQIVLPTQADIEGFFFEASLKGYAGGGEYEFEGVRRGSVEKTFRYTNADSVARKFELKYVDRYSSHGEFSRGDKTIYLNVDHDHDSPVWAMSYHGWCGGDSKRYHKFLKEHLRRTYEQKQFFGGRGWRTGDDAEGKLFYFNEWEGDFSAFHGREWIEESPATSAQPLQVFWHRFQGLLMLPSPEMVGKF